MRHAVELSGMAGNDHENHLRAAHQRAAAAMHDADDVGDSSRTAQESGADKLASKSVQRAKRTSEASRRREKRQGAGKGITV